MRAGLLVLLLAGCSNGGPLWQECETETDCPVGYGCTRHETPNYCAPLCDVIDGDAPCIDALDDASSACGISVRCDPSVARPCGCDPDPDGRACTSDTDCDGTYDRCDRGTCAFCGASGCYATCASDSDCAGARCVSGNCRP
jgi:hypothetical protein